MNPREIALKGLQSSTGMFAKDLEALPAEAFAMHFGGKSRTVADIVHEVNLVNEHIRQAMVGGPGFEWPEGWIKAPADLQEKDAVIASYKETIDRLMATVEGFTEEQWAEKMTTERGETDRFERCRFISMHLWYHSGQLNFIQTLLGDDDWHW